jgi:hypothetical protein
MSPASGPTAAILLTGCFVVVVMGALALGGSLVWTAARRPTTDETAAEQATRQATTRQLEEERLRLERDFEESRAKVEAMARQLREARDDAEKARLQMELERARQAVGARRSPARGGARAP